MILYLKDLKNSTKILLDIINSFSKVLRHKVNPLNTVAYQYSNNEQVEKEYRKIIPFTVASIKYLGINFKKDVKELPKEKYKLLQKETEEEYRRWKP
jgi:hypothetical protein